MPSFFLNICKEAISYETNSFTRIWTGAGNDRPVRLSLHGGLHRHQPDAVPHQANGSVIEIDGKTYGSELLAQQFTKPEHLWGRPMSLDLTSFTDEEGNEKA